MALCWPSLAFVVLSLAVVGLRCPSKACNGHLWSSLACVDRRAPSKPCVGLHGARDHVSSPLLACGLALVDGCLRWPRCVWFGHRWPALACTGRRWPSFAWMWPVSWVEWRREATQRVVLTRWVVHVAGVVSNNQTSLENQKNPCCKLTNNIQKITYLDPTTRHIVGPLAPKSNPPS